MTRARRSTRAGFSLIEMMIALTIMVLIFSMALPFFRAQTRTVADFSGRLDAQQNARFAFNAIDRELRVAGVGVLDQQPMIVQADSLSITFNADLVSRDSGDASAIYYNPSVPSTETTSLPAARAITLPRSGTLYPSQDYTSRGQMSSAETISYWVSADSSSGRSDLYILWRRVNDGTPRVVAKNILLNGSIAPLFTYYRDSAGTLVSISRSRLPLIHPAVHGGAADTGFVAWPDSIRLVRVSVTAMYSDPKAGDITRKVEGNIRLLNIGLQARTTCGDVPLGVTLAGAVIPANPLLSIALSVRLSWNASTDQSGGEKDVERYVIYRRRNGTTDWGDPFVSIPATSATYTYTDTQVQSGQSWDYAVAAQDCTPVNSALSSWSSGLLP